MMTNDDNYKTETATEDICTECALLEAVDAALDRTAEAGALAEQLGLDLTEVLERAFTHLSLASDLLKDVRSDSDDDGDDAMADEDEQRP